MLEVILLIQADINKCNEPKRLAYDAYTTRANKFLKEAEGELSILLKIANSKIELASALFPKTENAFKITDEIICDGVDLKNNYLHIKEQTECANYSEELFSMLLNHEPNSYSDTYVNVNKNIFHFSLIRVANTKVYNIRVSWLNPIENKKAYIILNLYKQNDDMNFEQLNKSPLKICSISTLNDLCSLGIGSIWLGSNKSNQNSLIKDKKYLSAFNPFSKTEVMI